MITVLKSNSIQDIFQIVLKRYWDHSVNAKKAVAGDTIIVVPTKGELNNLNVDATEPVAIEFVVDKIERVTHEGSQSNEREEDTVEYNTRFHVRPGTIRAVDVKTVKFLLDEIGQVSVLYLDL